MQFFLLFTCFNFLCGTIFIYLLFLILNKKDKTTKKDKTKNPTSDKEKEKKVYSLLINEDRERFF